MPNTKKNTLSSDFLETLIESSGGRFSPEEFNELYSGFSAEAGKIFFPPSSEANLIRIIKALYGAKFFLRDCLQFPSRIELICKIAAFSNYLTDIILVNPEYLYFTMDRLENSSFKELISADLRSISSCQMSLSRRLNLLRTVKRKYCLAIGSLDILGIFDFNSVVDELSYLASCLCSSTFGLCLKETLRRKGQEEPRYCLAMLGKAGAEELNYSSDVDMILFSEKAESCSLLEEAARLFIASSSEMTEKGYIYRIDFRLRPEGRFAPLALPLEDMIRYYETKGEDWERQMLIKLGFCSGDRNLYQDFMNFTAKFVFPGSFYFSPFEEIKKMKANIEAHLSDQENIKLFKGGIRDIEFSLQALQLLNGHRIPELRVGNSLRAIEELSKNGLLSKNEEQRLRDAYVFYRKTEHFLQLMNDQQTHSIPRAGENLKKLSCFLGFDSGAELQAMVSRTRKEVRKIYEEFLIRAEGHRSSFSRIKFLNSQNAKRNIRFLRSGGSSSGAKEFDLFTMEQFDLIEKSLLGQLQRLSLPDQALAGLCRIIGSTGFPSLWYREFRDEKFLAAVLCICENSEFSLRLLSSGKKCMEMLLSRRALIKGTGLNGLDTEEVLFIVSVLLTIGIINATEASRLLSGFIESEILRIFSDLSLPYGYCLSAFGSLAASEIGLSSDMDLILIVEDRLNVRQASADFLKAVKTIEKKLYPFRTDLRLRAEGSSSPLVTDIESYTEYIRKRARIWEHQAITRSRFLSGKQELFNRFRNCSSETLRQMNIAEISSEINAMHCKIPRPLGLSIKKSKGCTITINFLIQYLCIKEGLPEEITGSLNIIEYFINLFPDYAVLRPLKEALLFYKKLEFSMELAFDRKDGIIPAKENELLHLSLFLGYKNTEDLNAEIQMQRTIVISIYNKFLGI